MPLEITTKLSGIPTGLQLMRKKGFNLQAYSRGYNGLEATNVARPGRWGNPFRIGVHAKDAREAIRLFSVFVADDPAMQARIKTELKGRNLACWCPVSCPCHRDILLMIANEI